MEAPKPNREAKNKFTLIGRKGRSSFIISHISSLSLPSRHERKIKLNRFWGFHWIYIGTILNIYDRKKKVCHIASRGLKEKKLLQFFFVLCEGFYEYERKIGRDGFFKCTFLFYLTICRIIKNLILKFQKSVIFFK